MFEPSRLATTFLVEAYAKIAPTPKRVTHPITMEEDCYALQKQVGGSEK